ncbi:hypothetical protein ACG7TL_001267 [Trametes sanguinea]
MDRDYKKQYPDAKLIAVDEAAKKKAKEGLKFDGGLRSYFSGFKNKDVAFFHPKSRTMIEADLLFNLPAREQYSKTGSPGYFPIFGNLNPYSWAHKRFAWSLGVDKEAMKRDVKTVAGWDFDRIIPCHGDVIEKNAKAAWLEAYKCSSGARLESALLQHCKDKFGHKPLTASATSATTTTARPAAAPAQEAGPSTPAAMPASSTKAKGKAAASVHYECQPCCLLFTDKAAYDDHNQRLHPPPKAAPKFKCPPCGVEFSSSEALSLHCRNSFVHPKCPKCNSAFIDQTQLKLHMVVHENTFSCGPCGREIKVSERQQHYKESRNHPSCFVCEERFYDDADLDKCKRQFRSADELQNHYLVSPMHPHCAICEIGFVDDVACDKSSPLVQRSSLSDVALAMVATASLAVAQEKSELGDDSYETIEASSHVQRAVSEPTVPTVSSIGPSSVQGAAMMASRSPTISELSFDDMVRRRNVMRHPDSESTLSLRSVSSSSSMSSGPGYIRNPALARAPQQTAFVETSVPQPASLRPSSVPQQVVYARQSSYTSASALICITAAVEGIRVVDEQPTSGLPVPEAIDDGRCILKELGKTGSCPVCGKLFLLRLHVEAD